MTADNARILSTSPSIAAAAQAPLRLIVDGLDAGERATLGAILDVLAGKLPRPWVVVEGSDADLYLHARGTRRGNVRAGVVALLVRDDEAQPPADQLWMPVPVRVMAMLELLQGVQDRLGLAHVEAAAPGDDVAANDEKSLASSLARLFAGPVEQSVRVRILGFGTLYVCRASDSYRTDFEHSRLREALEAKRFILTAISPDSVELAATDTQAYPLEGLLWPIGLMTPREQRAEVQPRMRLRQWPDFASLPHDPRHLQVCALLGTTPMNLQEIVAVSGLNEVQVDRFLHACELCRLLEPVADAVPAQRQQHGIAAASLGKLFDRLWRRLVK